MTLLNVEKFCVGYNVFLVSGVVGSTLCKVIVSHLDGYLFQRVHFVVDLRGKNGLLERSSTIHFMFFFPLSL